MQKQDRASKPRLASAQMFEEGTVNDGEETFVLMPCDIRRYVGSSFPDIMSPKKGAAAKTENFSFSSLYNQMGSATARYQSQVDAGLDADEILTALYESWVDKIGKAAALTDEE